MSTLHNYESALEHMDRVVGEWMQDHKFASPQNIEKLKGVLADEVHEMTHNRLLLPAPMPCGCCDLVSFELVMIGDHRACINLVTKNRGELCH